MTKKKRKPPKHFDFPFTSHNYKLLIIGIVIIIIGFILMTGGGSDDPDVFRYDAIFSFRRITLAPLVTIFGFIFVIYAIMKNPKRTEEDSQ